MNTGVPRRRRRSPHAPLALFLACLSTLVVLTGAATAAPTSNSRAVPVQSSQLGLGGFLIPGPVVLPLPLPIALTDITVTANAKWSGDLTTSVGWDTANVRQGADLDISRSVPLPSGTIDVKWQVSGKVFGVADFGPVNLFKDSVSCAPKLSDGGFTCAASSNGFWLPGAIPSPILTTLIVAVIQIGVKFDVTPDGAIVTRGFSVGGHAVAGPDDLSLTEAPQNETFSLPCTAQAGDAVDYGLDPYHWAPDTTATQQTVIRIINTGPFGIDEAFQYGPDIPIGPASASNPAFDLTGNGFVTAMGPLLANNVNPTIDPLGPFSGDEGSLISFSASVDSQCPIGSYVWEFSDGTKSFGPSPQRAFGDNGVFDGQLTVTDITGLSATKSFTASVANVKPSVNAGPDTTADWGRLVQFNGQATDPGWGDQPTLQYTWTFGDGTPSASGGPSVLHAYAMPGSYAATLDVCDKNSACDGDSRTVLVTKRDTTLGYTGPLSSSPSKTITLTANLVDEYGQAVSGRKVSVTLGAQSAVGTTDSSGNASVKIKLNQKPGTYTLNASFTADAKYNGSSDGPLNFVVGKK